MQSRKLTNMIIGISSLGNERRFVRRRCPVSGIPDYVRRQRKPFNMISLSIYQEQHSSSLHFAIPLLSRTCWALLSS
jgi:hypothetical protein